jgi:hypothetical protein
MKRLLVLLVILLFQGSCIGPCGPNRCENTAFSFLKLVQTHDLGKAAEMCTDKGENKIYFFINNRIDLPLTEVKDVKCRVRGDSAHCYFCCFPGSKYFEDSLLLVRKEGEVWLVDDISDFYRK